MSAPASPAPAQVSVKNGGTVARANSSDAWAQVDQPMTSGVHRFEFTLIEDSNGGECTCFGVSIEKPQQQSYEYNSCFALVRCFNGQLYNFGSSEEKIDKIHPKDKIQMELNMDSGVLSFWINGKKQAKTISGLRKHKKLYPVVQFYSGSREVSVNWFKSKGGDAGAGEAASASVSLSGIEPQSRVSHALPLGLADRTGDMSAPISLNGGEVLGASGLAITLKGEGNSAGGCPVDDGLMPAGGAATQVTWNVSETAADYFRCTVGICDPPAKPEGLGAGGGGGVAAAAAAAAAAAVAAAASSAAAVGGADESKEDGKEEEDAAEEDSESKADGAAPADAGASSPDGPTVTMLVLADGAPVFTSRPFTVTKDPSAMPYGHPGLAPEPCLVRIAGCKTLSLVVRSDAPVPEGLHAVFATPQLIAAPWMARAVGRTSEAAAAIRAAGGDPLLGATTGLAAAGALAAAVAPIADEAAGSRAGRVLRPLPWSQPPSMVLPFVAEPTSATVGAAVALIAALRPAAAAEGGSPGPAAGTLTQVLSLVSLQLRSLVYAGVHPSAVGFSGVKLPGSVMGQASDLVIEAPSSKPTSATSSAPASPVAGAEGGASAAADTPAATAAPDEPSSAASSSEAAAAAPASELELLRDAMVSLNDDASLTAEVRASAAAVIDENLDLFYPTPEARRALVSSITAGGHSGAVEVRFSWPARAKGAAAKAGLVTGGIGVTDPRFERAALLLHAAASTMGMSATVVSLWRRSVHVILAPATPAAGAPARDAGPGPIIKLLLGGGMAGVLQSAGIPGWSFPEGVPVEAISCGIERLVSFDRRARAAKEPGLVSVRLYPGSIVGPDGVEAITASARAFLESERAAAEAEEALARAAGPVSAFPAVEEEGAAKDDAGSDADSGDSGSGSDSSGPDSDDEEEGSDGSVSDSESESGGSTSS